MTQLSPSTATGRTIGGFARFFIAIKSEISRERRTRATPTHVSLLAILGELIAGRPTVFLCYAGRLTMPDRQVPDLGRGKNW